MNLPRPEYPRPDFAREHWINLNGAWEFEFDDRNAGLRERWFKDGHTLSRTIQVPFAYQAPLSGIGETDVHEVVWYARHFDAPPFDEDHDVLLHFGAVDYRCTVWVNGKEAGTHNGGHVPFWFNVAPYLRPGANRLVVRVEDRQTGYQPRGKQSISGKPRTVDYYCTTGIWQTVWLEPVAAHRFSFARVRPQLQWHDGGDAFELFLTLHAPSRDWIVEVEVSDQGRIVASRKEQGGASYRMLVPIPNAKRWSPDSPFLYDIRLRLFDGETLVDEVQTYAGMRSIRVRGAEIRLNDEPIYLKMVLDQGYWPDGLMTAPTDAALRRDIELAKQMGFNGARKHQKIEDPRWLYWCDRLGFLSTGEMANARRWSHQSEELFVKEWQDAIQRDLNHPCLILWVPVNESWGLPGLRRLHPAQFAFLERIVDMTRRIDPSRPVVDNDGWEHTDVSDIAALHDYTQTASELLERYKDKLAGGELPERTWGKGRLSSFLHGAKYRGQPVVLSEVGGFLMIPPLHGELDVLYSIYGTTQSERELMAKFEDLMSGIAALTFLSGFCYTQLTDIEQERNGLLEYDRTPKVPLDEIARVLSSCFESVSNREAA